MNAGVGGVKNKFDIGGSVGQAELGVDGGRMGSTMSDERRWFG